MSDILLVEDDLSLIEGLEFSLGKSGFNIDIARTVRDTFTKLEDKNYDLLLIDLALHDGNGFEICRRVRQTSCIPIIFLTASG